MTPEQETELLASNKALQEQLQKLMPVVGQVGELTSKVSTLQTENQELKKGVNLSSQESAVLALKTKYPDVPEETLRAFPAEVRDAQCAKIQESISKVKAESAKTNPNSSQALWMNAGGIGPTDDATVAAELAARNAKIAEAKASGNVFDMLKARSNEVTSFLRQSLATSK